ncbi:MAG: hypothetical protein QM589_14670 [Thermomicrobiales bacterium]
MTDDRFRAQPADPDSVDALNTALDGEPTTRSEAIAPLLDVARLVRATPLGAEEEASFARLDALWDEVLAASRPRPATIGSKQAVAFQAAALPSLGLPAVPRPREHRGRSGLRAVGSWLSMAAIAAVLLAMVSMAWSLRPGGGDGNLLASATSLAVGTALASPSPVATESWLAWPDPADCDAAPMSHEDYAEIMQTQPDISGRSYAVAGRPSDADAVAAADAARRQFACEAFSLRAQERTLSSPSYTFFQSDSAARTISRSETLEADLTHGMLLSATIDPKAPSAYIGLPEGTPASAEPRAWPYWERAVQLPAGVQFVQVVTFDPMHAVSLDDGRIALPATMLGFLLDGQRVTQEDIARFDVDLPPLDAVAPPLYVMTQESGHWVVDEVLTYCPFAGCGPVWTWLAEDGGVPLPAPDVPVPWAIPTGTATPVASPGSTGTATPVM